MKIKTKFNVGQRVYFIEKDVIRCKICKRVVGEKLSPSSYKIEVYGINIDINTIFFSVAKLRIRYETPVDNFPEGELFTSKLKAKQYCANENKTIVTLDRCKQCFDRLEDLKKEVKIIEAKLALASKEG